MSNHPLDIIKKAMKITDEVIVGFSCGKDSVVTLDLCFKHFKKIYVYFMYLIPGLTFQERYIEFIEKRYKINVLRMPHWQLSGMMQNASLRYWTDKTVNLPSVNATDAENYARRKLGCKWIATGEMKVDSMNRRGMLSANKGLSLKRKRIYPLSDWSTINVFNYMKRNKLPLSLDYALFGCKSRGGSFGRLWAEELLAIKKAYPEDYHAILNYFPFAEAQVKRHEYKIEKQVVAAPKV